MKVKCLNCGAVCDSTGYKPRQFCSKKCWAQHRRRLEAAEKDKEKTVCKHNPGVDCVKQDRCDTCGWNPNVSAIRFKEATAHGTD